MNLDEFVVIIDEKWRLRIPAKLSEKVGRTVFVSRTDSECLQIHLKTKNGTRVQVSTKGGKRFLVPKSLRKSNSFYFGRKVRLVYSGDTIEIKPWK